MLFAKRVYMVNGQYMLLFLSSLQTTIIGYNDLVLFRLPDDYICFHCHHSNIAALKNIISVLMIHSELPEEDGQL